MKKAIFLSINQQAYSLIAIWQTILRWRSKRILTWWHKKGKPPTMILSLTLSSLSLKMIGSGQAIRRLGQIMVLGLQWHWRWRLVMILSIHHLSWFWLVKKKSVWAASKPFTLSGWPHLRWLTLTQKMKVNCLLAVLAGVMPHFS